MFNVSNVAEEPKQKTDIVLDVMNIELNSFNLVSAPIRKTI